MRVFTRASSSVCCRAGRRLADGQNGQRELTASLGHSGQCPTAPAARRAVRCRRRVQLRRPGVPDRRPRPGKAWNSATFSRASTNSGTLSSIVATVKQRNRLTSFSASCTSGWTLMPIRGGGDPGQNTVIEPFVRMGPLPRSLASEAHDCFMVRTLVGPTEYKVAARASRALAGSPRIVCCRWSVDMNLPSTRLHRLQCVT